MPMTNIMEDFGKYILARYQELKSMVKEKGNKEGEQYVVPEDLQVADKAYILAGSQVDEDPQTPDLIRTYVEKKPSSPDVKEDFVQETFMEKLINGRLAITYNYLETIAFQNSIGTASFEKVIDAKTGETISQ